MPPAQKAYLQSVYDYSAWPTELRAQVAGVRYSFSSPQTRATEELLSAASKFYELHPELQTERVVGPEVPQGSTKVTAVYYDDEQRAVGIGIDQLDWQGEEVVLKASTIESVKGASAQLEVPGAVLGLQEELDYTFNLTLAEASEPIAITPFLEELEMDPCLELVADRPGILRGVKLGTAPQFMATWPTAYGILEAESKEPVYVTQQKASLELVRLPVGGREVTLIPTPDSSEPSASTILMVDLESPLVKQIYAEQEGVELTPESGEAEPSWVALNSQPLGLSLVYGAEPDLGSTPPAQTLKETKEVTFKVQTLEGEAPYTLTPDADRILFAPARPQTEEGVNHYQMVATYLTPAGTELQSSTLDLVAVRGEISLHWARQLAEGTTYERLPKSINVQLGPDEVLNCDGPQFEAGYFNNWTPSAALTYLASAQYSPAKTQTRYYETNCQLLKEEYWLSKDSLQQRHIYSGATFLPGLLPSSTITGGENLHWNLDFHNLAFQVPEQPEDTPKPVHVGLALDITPQQRQAWKIGEGPLQQIECEVIATYKE